MITDKKIIVAGHVCLDITPIVPDGTDGNNFQFTPGKLITMDGVDVHTGGAVSNTGLALHILGANVSLMGKIGNDEFGRLIIEGLERYRVNCEHDMIITPYAQTSFSVVIAIPGVNRTFLHCPGANDTFCSNDIDYDSIRNAALFHFGYPPLMKKMYENDGEDCIRMFQTVKSLGVATSLDMSFIDGESDAAKADWGKILKNLLPYVDFFLPSAEELCMMLHPDRFDEWNERANGDPDIMQYVDIEKDIKPLAEELMSYHAKVVVIKCGSKGLYYTTGSYNALTDIGANASINLSAWADKEEWIKPYKPEFIRSGVGAGDACIAAFLAATLEGMPIHDAARLAAAEGACSLEGYDALSSLRTLPELQKMFLMGY